MSDHIEQMKAEHKELKERTGKLNALIHGSEVFQTLDDLEQARMIKQAGFMEAYQAVLESRIWSAQGA